MTQPVSSHEKARKPSTHFTEPLDVVADHTLSNTQKSQALETLEQDARQESQATADGMSGAPAIKLHDVLGAKDHLAAEMVDEAYASVMRDLRSREQIEETPARKVLLGAVIVALEKLDPPRP